VCIKHAYYFCVARRHTRLYILRPIDKEAVFQFNSKYLQLFFATKSDIMCLQQIPQCFLNQHL
jgi:hypothetical protein